mmetsp:Transcript_72513/g.143796  ORF Transcript_72513/g.143796 Transcript_72513/m.143796 type:complete len:112 (+) Transcript_72513:117-452(+)
MLHGDCGVQSPQSKNVGTKHATCTCGQQKQQSSTHLHRDKEAKELLIPKACVLADDCSWSFVLDLGLLICLGCFAFALLASGLRLTASALGFDCTYFVEVRGSNVAVSQQN